MNAPPLMELVCLSFSSLQFHWISSLFLFFFIGKQTNSLPFNQRSWLNERKELGLPFFLSLCGLCSGAASTALPLHSIKFHLISFRQACSSCFQWREREIEFDEGEERVSWLIEWAAELKTYNQPPVIQQSLIVNEGPAITNQQSTSLSSQPKKEKFLFWFAPRELKKYYNSMELVNLRMKWKNIQ